MSVVGGCVAEGMTVSQVLRFLWGWGLTTQELWDNLKHKPTLLNVYVRLSSSFVLY